MKQDTLNIIEIFASVQGETSYSGLPTTFIRLAACNLRCSWCDTPYSFGRGTPYSLGEILSKTDLYSCRYVCITGGEPLLQENVYPLMSRLCDKGYILSLETGGSLCSSKVDPRVRIILDVKCPQSGMCSKNYWPNLRVLRENDEVKFVIQNEEDYQYAKEVSDQYKLLQRNNPILLSPVHGILDPKELISWILKDKLHARLNLQIHKYIWAPETRGV